jgi:hypothetical protein
MQGQPANKSSLQLKLEKFFAEVNPARLVIGTDTEYEDEVRMFLERINESMNAKQLVEVLHKIFCEMFNTPKENRNLDPYGEIVSEYLRLRDS